ncbi:MAG TPA: multiheme c-type cytochrome [bacterium]
MSISNRVRTIAICIILAILAGFITVISCSGGGSPVIPQVAATYVGTQKCASCHAGYFKQFAASGHANILKPVSGGAPAYPNSSVPNPPAGTSWADIKYVVGGHGWKANFVGKDGFLFTGPQAEYDLANGSWSALYPGEKKYYDCAKCHTTGYTSGGNKDGLSGISGNWLYSGVQCEACHGPGSNHAENPTTSNINVNTDPEDACASCHIRTNEFTIEASGGFILNRQQYTELENSPHHDVFTCATCHDPHNSAIYSDPDFNPDKGIETECVQCHTGKVVQKSDAMRKALTCMDCHMPPLVRSINGDVSKFTGDVSTHLMRINIDPSAPQFSPDGTSSNPYVTLQYACKRCHMDGGVAQNLSLQVLADYAFEYHGNAEPGTFVKSDTCKACHEDIYDTFIETGHPQMLKPVDSSAPQYPNSSVPNPPPGYSWDEISYVVGGFGWKARFVDNQGYLITGSPGDKTQYNIADGSWSEYHAGDMVGYDCAVCHTTGYSSSGHQDGLSGISGTWEQSGVHCEACHGSGGAHVGSPSPDTINIEMPARDRCAICHTRGTPGVLEASDGFIMSEAQAEEISLSPHSVLECSTCHDPHRSVVYSDPVSNPDQGLVKSCNECHPTEASIQKSANMKAALSCQDCHMAPMVKSALGDLSIFTADENTHLFRINTDVNAEQFSPDGTQANPYITISYACQRCHIDGGGAPPISKESLASYAVNYHSTADPDAIVGDQTCRTCHSTIYDPYSRTGHAYILNNVNNAAPAYPYSSVDSLPPGYLWNDIRYVIGGYKWRANFIGYDGYILTGGPGDKTMYSFVSGEWESYNPGMETDYDCGRCHTTGFTPGGHQDGLPGMTGTWEHMGVQCEACHGPGGAHVSAPSPSTINVDMNPNDSCATCHSRGQLNIIEAANGFGKNHSQVEELMQSPHDSFQCSSCHDPHRSVSYEDATYNPDKGLVVNCETCHAEKVTTQRSAGMQAILDCIDCHMPPMDKSGYGDLSTFTADVKSHLFRINTDPSAAQFSPDGTTVNGYLTVKYACQRCHIDGGTAVPLPLEGLAAYADGYHSTTQPTDYVSSEMCRICHSGTYDKFQFTGHANVLTEVDGAAPVYPYSSVPNPPSGYTWNDVDYVIGGWGWKSLFIGNDGYIITGNSSSMTQYNLETEEWVEYFAGDTVPYNCGSCHTTGYSPSGNQNGKPGIVGTWNEDGVQCEACHGSGGAHISDPMPSNINASGDPSTACMNCHSRGTGAIEAKDGFTMNYTQWDEFMVSPHSDMLTCITCHDPHASVLYDNPVYNPNQGLNISCETCHPDEAANQKSTAMSLLDIGCTGCHMPPMVRSADANPSIHTADMSSHLWEINLEPGVSQFSPDGTETMPYLTVEYVCLRCHTDGGGAHPMSIGQAETYSVGYHE